MKNKITVTIGIPARNEEYNILHLLRRIISQKEYGFEIKKIIVISDASTDKTDYLVSQMRDSRILLISNKVRKGQIHSQNTIFSLANTDVVVLFEADTCPKDDTYLTELLEPMTKNKNIGIVQGNPVPLKPITLVEKILYAQDFSFCRFAKTLKNPEELFISGGGGRAFAKSVYKKLSWPKDVPEDSYAFFWSKLNGIKIAFQPTAICTYRLPQTIGDHLIKKEKVISGQKTLEKHFSNKLLSREYIVPKGLMIKASLSFLITQPILFMGYLIIRSMEKCKLNKTNFTDYWIHAGSTKILFE